LKQRKKEKDIQKYYNGSKRRSISEGFTDLHTLSYKDILQGGGFGLDDAEPSIQIVSEIRRMNSLGIVGDYHPYLEGLK